MPNFIDRLGNLGDIYREAHISVGGDVALRGRWGHPIILLSSIKRAFSIN